MRKFYLAIPVSLALCSIAQAEVTNCTAITSLPAVINQPGIWCLNSDLSTNIRRNAIIKITAAGVTLDLNGHTLSGLPGGTTTGAVGIFVSNTTGVTVRNGAVRGFGTGVLLNGAASAGHVIERLTVDQSRSIGIMAQGNGIVLRDSRVTNTVSTAEDANAIAVKFDQSTNITIRDNQITNTQGNGISTGYALIVNNTSNADIEGNTIRGYGYGILADSSPNLMVNRNVLWSGGFGITTQNSSQATCTNNVVNNDNANVDPNCSYKGGNLAPF